jgi:hypothetical protein
MTKIVEISHLWPCEKGDDCCACRDIAAAIRALKGEGDE